MAPMLALLTTSCTAVVRLLKSVLFPSSDISFIVSSSNCNISAVCCSRMFSCELMLASCELI